MKILLLETFFTGSHRKWAEDFKRFSRHEIEIVSLSGHHWKWRMHGGAISLSQKLNNITTKPNLILATDMIDLGLFLSLTREWSHNIPTAVYFHENQLNYPWSPTDKDVRLKRDNHYAFINYSTALTANHIFFNSTYHHSAFINELPQFLKAFPDNNNLRTVDLIASKSSILPLALDLKKFDSVKPESDERKGRAVILWNHRWEYDKNPDLFFNTLFELNEHGIDFKLIIAGEKHGDYPTIFNKANSVLSEKIIHFGYAKTFEEYAQLLWQADILPVTSVQDFFGGSVVEAMYCNVVPLLPNRLAYPEHIPSNLFSTFFYDEVDFAKKLQRRIMDVKYQRVMNTQQHVLKYDWSNLIEKYDHKMEQVAASKKS